MQGPTEWSDRLAMSDLVGTADSLAERDGHALLRFCGIEKGEPRRHPDGPFADAPEGAVVVALRRGDGDEALRAGRRASVALVRAGCVFAPAPVWDAVLAIDPVPARPVAYAPAADDGQEALLRRADLVGVADVLAVSAWDSHDAGYRNRRALVRFVKLLKGRPPGQPAPPFGEDRVNRLNAIVQLRDGDFDEATFRPGLRLRASFVAAHGTRAPGPVFRTDPAFDSVRVLGWTADLAAAGTGALAEAAPPRYRDPAGGAPRRDPYHYRRFWTDGDGRFVGSDDPTFEPKADGRTWMRAEREGGS